MLVMTSQVVDGEHTCDNIVAPSFVTVMSPSGEMRILSNPRGPCSHVSDSSQTIPTNSFIFLTSEVRTIFATVLAARMWDLTASFPCCLFFLP